MEKLANGPHTAYGQPLLPLKYMLRGNMAVYQGTSAFLEYLATSWNAVNAKVDAFPAHCESRKLNLDSRKAAGAV